MFFLRSLGIMSFGVGPNADRRANPLNYLREEGSNFGADSDSDTFGVISLNASRLAQL